jgi:hypothetical protein
MAGWFKNLKLQMKFMLVIGAGLFVLGALAVTAQGFIEYGSMQQRLRDVSERELNSTERSSRRCHQGVRRVVRQPQQRI